MKSSVSSAFCSTFVCLLMLASRSFPAHGAWDSQIILDSGLSVRHPSVLNDADGRLHVVYFNETSNTLEYACQSDGSWQYSTIVRFTGSLTSLDMALDGAGVCHLIFVEDGSYPQPDFVKYACQSNNSWSVRVVESASYNYHYANIEVDKANRPHVVYTRRPYSFSQLPPYDLRFACLAEEPLLIKTLHTTRDWAGITCAVLKLQATGDPFISFADTPESGSGRALKILRRENDLWTTEEIKSTSSSWAFTYVAMALDSSDVPHFIYDLGNLFHTRREGSLWQTSLICSQLVEYAHVDMAVDSRDHCHVTFSSGAGVSPVYYSTWNGTNWAVHVASSSNGSEGSITLNPVDQPVLVFRSSRGYLAQAFQDSLEGLGSLLLSSIALSNGFIVMRWQAESNGIYRLQCSPDLLNWSSVGRSMSDQAAGFLYAGEGVSECATTSSINRMFLRVFQSPILAP